MNNQQNNQYQQPNGQQNNQYQQPNGQQNYNQYQQPNGQQNYNQYQQPNGQQNYNQYQQPNGNNGNGFLDQIKNFILNTPQCKDQISPRDISDNKTITIFAYFGLLLLIPLLACKNSRFARFHANQGLILFLFNIAATIVVSIVTFVFGFIPVLGTIVNVIMWLAYYVFAIGLFVLGIYNVVKGRVNELPLIGGFRLIKTVEFASINNGTPANNGYNNMNNGAPVNNGYNNMNNGAPVNNGYNNVNNGAPANNGYNNMNNGTPVNNNQSNMNNGAPVNGVQDNNNNNMNNNGTMQ